MHTHSHTNRQTKVDIEMLVSLQRMSLDWGEWLRVTEVPLRHREKIDIFFKMIGLILMTLVSVSAGLVTQVFDSR